MALREASSPGPGGPGASDEGGKPDDGLTGQVRPISGLLAAQSPVGGRPAATTPPTSADRVLVGLYRVAAADHGLPARRLTPVAKKLQFKALYL